MRLSPHHTGIIAISFSAFVWSTLGLFAQGIVTDVWVILFWRGLFSIIFLALYISYKREQGIVNEFKSLGWPGWLSAIVGAAASLCFISAFKYTSIAHVSVIYATVPFIVSILSWLILGEALTLTTIFYALLCLAGVTIMVQELTTTGHIIGDALALLMALGMSILVILYRKYPKRPMVLAALVCALINVLISLYLTNPFTVSGQEFVALIAFGALFATASILTVEGSRLIPAFQSAIISALEAPLAVLWAWLVFTQIPTTTTWIGAGLVMLAVGCNIYSDRHSIKNNT